MNGVRMTTRTRKPLRTIIGLGMVIALTACASTTNPDESPSDGDTPQILTVASPMSISSLDPHGPASGDRPTITVFQHVFDSLVVREGSDFVPSLATSWEHDDPLVWLLELDSDGKFLDVTPEMAACVVVSEER